MAKINQAFAYDQEFRTATALAEHVARIVGQTMPAVMCQLRKFDGDVNKVIAYYRDPNRRQPKLPLPVTYDGIEFPSRGKCCMYLSKRLGVSYSVLLSQFRRFDGDADKVVAHNLRRQERRRSRLT